MHLLHALKYRQCIVQGSRFCLIHALACVTLRASVIGIHALPNAEPTYMECDAVATYGNTHHIVMVC